MRDRIIIPNSAKFDDSCVNQLKIYLCNYIFKNNHRYVADGLIIYIRSNYLKIKYNHHYYYVIIIKENNIYYWQLRPYNKSFYTTPYDNANSFELVIMAIKENDKLVFKGNEKNQNSKIC